jgi:uncharacterized protein YkwD
MHAIQALSVLALAASALAVPHGRKHVVNDVKVVYETVTVVVDDSAPAPTPAPEPVVENYVPVVYTTVIEAPAPPPTEVYTPPAPAPVVEEPKAAPPAPPKAAPPKAPATGTGYMAVVEEWRGKLGLSSLTQDSTLEANAHKTAQDGNGQMVHQLNAGSMGQVLAPGQPDDFVKVFVGGWLCEKPNMPGLDGACSALSSGWVYTSTGHADILTSPSYSKIGCACVTGIWACDVA